MNPPSELHIEAYKEDHTRRYSLQYVNGTELNESTWGWNVFHTAPKILSVHLELSGQLAQILRHIKTPCVCNVFLIYLHLRRRPVCFLYSYRKFSLEKH
jgi:hypothetical protein